jgi:hypothetical protein
VLELRLGRDVKVGLYSFRSPRRVLAPSRLGNLRSVHARDNVAIIGSSLRL